MVTINKKLKIRKNAISSWRIEIKSEVFLLFPLFSLFVLEFVTMPYGRRLRSIGTDQTQPTGN